MILPPINNFKSDIIILNPYWIIGFICGEGSFTYYTKQYINTKKLDTDSYDSNLNDSIINYKDNQGKFYYSLAVRSTRRRREISQRTKDLYILKGISNYFGAGIIYSDKKGISKVKFNNIKIIQHRLLPFFYFFPLSGFKQKQYEIWLRAVILKLSYFEHAPKKEIKNKSLYKKDEYSINIAAEK